ncbi:deoxycytidylate deaminase [Bacillus phage 0305phi8-36]|uniref:dCMP deaminase n=1 Tax=Bacillus phage 0305phi8-36 TaxID=458639 RepID=UPI00015A1F47|nr:dCMP deaminase [Bacillus phage 0305phi8-36]ABS83773.1 deoxycytidylate deaminase [Bacillus phage 0305phi8-36]
MPRYLVSNIHYYMLTIPQEDEMNAVRKWKTMSNPQVGLDVNILKLHVEPYIATNVPNPAPNALAISILIRCTEEEMRHLKFFYGRMYCFEDYTEERYHELFPEEKKPNPKRVRKPWDQYFIEQALHVAERGTCSRARVGCVLVKENRVIATGYNGSPKGMPHCDDIGHLMKDGHCVRTNHAEENALLQCARLGISSEGATAYVTHEPCLYCTRQLNQAGIKRIVYVKPYPNDYNEYFIGDMDWEQYEGEIQHGNI